LALRLFLSPGLRRVAVLFVPSELA
jgi:hypothetical protein